MKSFLGTKLGKVLASLITIGGLTLSGVYTYNQGANEACKAIINEVLPTAHNGGDATSSNNPISSALAVGGN